MRSVHIPIMVSLNILINSRRSLRFRQIETIIHTEQRHWLPRRYNLIMRKMFAILEREMFLVKYFCYFLHCFCYICRTKWAKLAWLWSHQTCSHFICIDSRKSSNQFEMNLLNVIIHLLHDQLDSKEFRLDTPRVSCLFYAKNTVFLL